MPEGGKSEAKLYQASLRRISVDECKMIQRITQILEKMEEAESLKATGGVGGGLY